MADSSILRVDLLQGGWRNLSFAPFREGITIHRLYGDGQGGPASAILRYQPGATVPLHEHMGWEHVLVLEGEQTDERGRYEAGTLLMSQPGSRHSVRSETGCAALLFWEKPVRIIA
jgi:anti-sigma factor ChrR (cupin superfamily)